MRHRPFQICSPSGNHTDTQTRNKEKIAEHTVRRRTVELMNNEPDDCGSQQQSGSRAPTASSRHQPAVSRPRPAMPRINQRFAPCALPACTAALATAGARLVLPVPAGRRARRRRRRRAPRRRPRTRRARAAGPVPRRARIASAGTKAAWRGWTAAAGCRMARLRSGPWSRRSARARAPRRRGTRCRGGGGSGAAAGGAAGVGGSAPRARAARPRRLGADRLVRGGPLAARRDLPDVGGRHGRGGLRGRGFRGRDRRRRGRRLGATGTPGTAGGARRVGASGSGPARRGGRRGRRRRGRRRAGARPDVLVLVLAGGLRLCGLGRPLLPNRRRPGRGAPAPRPAARRPPGRTPRRRRARRLRPVGVELPGEVLERHVHGQRQVAARQQPVQDQPLFSSSSDSMSARKHVWRRAYDSIVSRCSTQPPVAGRPGAPEESSVQAFGVQQLTVKRLGATAAAHDRSSSFRYALAQKPQRARSAWAATTSNRRFLRRRREGSACPFGQLDRPAILGHETGEPRVGANWRVSPSAFSSPAGTAPRPRTP